MRPRAAPKQLVTCTVIPHTPAACPMLAELLMRIAPLEGSCLRHRHKPHWGPVGCMEIGIAVPHLQGWWNRSKARNAAAAGVVVWERGS